MHFLLFLCCFFEMDFGEKGPDFSVFAGRDFARALGFAIGSRRVLHALFELCALLLHSRDKFRRAIVLEAFFAPGSATTKGSMRS